MGVRRAREDLNGARGYKASLAMAAAAAMATLRGSEQKRASARNAISYVISLVAAPAYTHGRSRLRPLNVAS